MLINLVLPSLQQRRELNKIVFIFKIAGSMMPAIDTWAIYRYPSGSTTLRLLGQFVEWSLSRNVTSSSLTLSNTTLGRNISSGFECQN